MIDELDMKCKHNASGCPEKFKVGKLKEHEAICEHYPVACSNQGCDEVAARRIMKDHAPLCQF